jgi:hypothetical protein
MSTAVREDGPTQHTKPHTSNQLAASERYSDRIRRVTGDRGVRALHKLVLDNLTDQCTGKVPRVDGLKSASKAERTLACKSIADQHTAVEFEGLLDGIIDLFIVITGRAYNGEAFEEMVTEIRRVQLFLQEQAQLLGLFGDMRSIHTAVVVNDLFPYTDETLVEYCQLLFVDIPDVYLTIYDSEPTDASPFTPDQREELINYTLYGKLANLERMRIGTYVHDTLFGDVDNRGMRYEGALTFYDAPSSDDVIRNGVNYYYPRVGALTNEDLIARFHPFELLVILSQLQRGRLVTRIGWRSYDISSRIITAIYLRTWDDPRNYLTPLGVRSTIHAPTYIPLLTLSRDFRHSREDLEEACLREGIRVEGWKGRSRAMRDLLFDYLLAQLAEDFVLRLPETRDRQEVSLGVYISAGEMVPHAEPRNDVVWYGGRNGTSSYRCMTTKCLTDLWTRTHSFACPFDTTHTFSLRSMRRLAYVLSQEGNGTKELQYLSSVVSDLLWPATRRFGVPAREEQYINGVFERQSQLIATMRATYTRSRLAEKLRLLQNLGNYLAWWTDDGPIQLVKRELDGTDDAMGIQRANALLALTSIWYSLEDVPELLQLRIVRVLAERPVSPLGSPEYLDEAAPYPLIEIENDGSTIGDFLRSLVSAHRFGIDTLLEHAGGVLQATSEKYAQELVDKSFFYATRVEVVDPHLEVVDLGVIADWHLDPTLLDLVKGEPVPIDVRDGKWKELPVSTDS